MNYTLKYDGGYYLDNGTQRTRLYTTVEAANRAVARDDVYTYAAYRTLLSAPAPRRRGVQRKNAIVRLP